MTHEDKNHKRPIVRRLQRREQRQAIGGSGSLFFRSVSSDRPADAGPANDASPGDDAPSGGH